MKSIIDPNNVQKKKKKESSVLPSTPPTVHLHTLLHCKTQMLLWGRTPTSMHSTLTLQHPPCMYLKHLELRSYLDAGVETEKEAKIGKCSEKSGHLCRSGGLCVG